MTPEDMDRQFYGAILLFAIAPLVFLACCIYLLFGNKEKKKLRLIAKILVVLLGILFLNVIYFGFIVEPDGI